MEGYLWKKGRKVPSMKRHYAVLKGTMLSFFVTQDEAQRSGAVPKRVLEVVDFRIMPGTPSSDAAHPPHIVLKFLDADGGGTLQCRADSRETQQVWLEALQHALKEPDRLAQDEINEVQAELLKDAQRHSRAVQQATEAVEAAGRQHREQANAEAALQQNRAIAVELNTQLETARALQHEALQKLQALQNALEDARHRVHASSIGAEDTSSFDQAMEAVERLAAKVELAGSAEATHARNVELLQLQTEANAREQLELVERVQKCAEESKILRQVAAKSLEDAQRAKQRTKRLASWEDESGPADGGHTRPSQLDPLAEGYLLCQHPMRTTMHRRYYVLTGNTLCWYADQDAYTTKMDAPSGVLHVAEVAEWDGKMKPTSPLRRLVVPFGGSAKGNVNEQYPNAFAVLTVEGKTLRCSAPLKKSQEDWISALHVGLTMPPLSPHRARAAKSRRDSFDLLASTPLSPKRQTEEPKKEEAKADTDSVSSPQPPDAAAATEAEALTSEVVVEGYLVGKSSLEETMKKKYCVLRALTLYVFTTHQEASTAAASESALKRPAIRSATFHACGVSSWDGHATLMHYDHGFLLQTTEHQTIYCSAPSLQEKNRWVSGVQQALLKYQHDSKRGSRLFDQPSESEDEEKTRQPQRRPSYGSARREFLSILQRYYAEYHPGKLGDVPMLLSRYQGREQALVEHLDRLYGTSMGRDSRVQLILSALVQAPSPHPAAPSPHSAPASPATRTSGDLTDWLTWNKDSSPSFCVLSGSRLERYDSEEQSGAGPPLAVFLVTGVHDYPTPSPTMNRSTMADQQLQFFLWQCFDSSVVAHSGRSALLSDEVVGLHPVTAKLAETMAFRLETQTNGVIMLRSDAAEIVHDWIHALRAAVANQSKPVVDVGSDEKKEEDSGSSFQQLRAKIVVFYEKHNPNKASDVDSLLHSFQGREGALLEQIDTVYKSNLATDPVCTSLCADLAAKYAEEHQSASPAKPAIETPVILMEGYLMKRGHKIPSMRKRYCVLVGNELSYFVTHDDSKNPGGGATTNPLGNFRVEVVGDWHGKTAAHTYEHGMELETTDGKTFFCAASSAKEKQQWVDAFRRGIALARNELRRAELEDEDGNEHERQLREQFREKLADFYRVRNPAKLPDLDLLLSCYAQRELALLQAIDEAYGTGLAADESLLSLLPPLPEQATALATLKLDGYLKKTMGDNTSSLWKRAQTVYVAVDGLTINLFATREGFKSGGAGLGESMTVLAVKDDDGRQSAANRFAVETSDHEWLRFEARDTMEKRLWVQVLRAALDTVLAQSLLADDTSMDPRSRASSVVVDARGFLLLRLDFNCAQEEHWKRREVAMPIEERAVALENGNEFVITKSTSSEKVGAEQARFRVVSTRAWAPSARCWPVTASNRAPRFPFQIVTQEQFVLSCSAATDAERAKWIRQLRLGAEQAAALEMLEEQLLETTAPMSPGRRSLVDKRERGFNEDGGVVVPPQPVLVEHKEEVEEPPMTGYLAFRLAQSPLSSGEARHASQVPIPHEGFVVLDMRAHIAVYEDESAYYRQDAPACEAQAVELLSEGVASIAVSTHSPKTKSTLRHFFPGAKEVVPSSLAFAVLLHPLRGDGNASADDLNNDHDEHTAMLEFFPTLPSQRDLWMEAFANRIDFTRGEALLADEKIILKLEREEEERAQEVVEEKNIEAGVDESAATGGEAGESEDSSDSDDDDSSDDSGFEDKPLTIDIDVSSPSEEAKETLPPQSEAAASFVFRAAAMEGLLTPWQTSTSPIRLPGSSKMKPMMSVYAVLIGCRLRCYSSREAAAAEDEPPSLDVEIVACTPWEAPNASWLTIGKENENLGFKMEVKNSRHGICFTALTIEAKHQWIHAIHHELNFVVAERSLSISERQFTQEVAAHLASIAASTAAAEANAIVGADASSTKVEGHLRKSAEKKKKTMKMKPLKLWKTRYCVVMGSHWLVYANQSQAISSGEAPTPVAVYELLGISVADGDNESSANEFSIHVVPGKHVKCRARSTLERKRWVNAVEDEILTQAKTSEDLERSMKEREEKLAAREAVKSKLHEVKTDARRLSALLGEAIQSARGDSDTDWDSDAHDNSSEEDSSLRQRSGPDYIDGSPESSPMRRNVGESAFSFDTLDIVKDSDGKPKSDSSSSSAFMTFFACFFRCVPLNSSGSNGRNVIAPLGIPGYPSTAAACSAQYTCDYYEDDGYRGLTK
ncbi:hypothetical protein PHYSODRAFT_529931 [Phytophthora sojae]|uniref:PH domain-containing protein n=1 Tax=Phytophthora sojae (strain P6497) TaxID=1094619 RepID=G5ABJ8_PHYSP|nr:hypothetical protein PHYSODRAFT_529931 [Phytophthora sojae]EGZ06723.1 hypothetical protein PHYSODRAFT_529931 [Phytophthora sojae]|eukprot:XP_009537487.1 hypothetical protein PHYSODRAFT_529931 [Phytophthora sojae]